MRSSFFSLFPHRRHEPIHGARQRREREAEAFIDRGDGKAALSWNDPGDSSITKWQYRTRQRDPDARPPRLWTSWTGWTDVADSTATTRGVLVTGREQGQEYQFNVQAVKSGGTGHNSYGQAVIEGTADAGEERASYRGRQSMRIEWTVGQFASPWSLQRRHVERANSNSADQCTEDLEVASKTIVAPTETYLDVTSLSVGTTYCFRMRFQFSASGTLNAPGNFDLVSPWATLKTVGLEVTTFTVTPESRAALATISMSALAPRLPRIAKPPMAHGPTK